MGKKYLLVTGFVIFSLLISFVITRFPNKKINQTNIPQERFSSDSGETKGIKDKEEGLDQVNLFKVRRVIDGDTIEIEDGRKVRYIGIDTPESTTILECFGKEANAKNSELVLGQEVRLEKDISETDKYGRLLRYVYVNNIFINELLIEEGYANFSSYPPDIKYQNIFLESEREAMENGRGLWGSTCSNEQKTGEDPCRIKGNISSSGEKIYHIQGQKYYDKTVIDQSKGEKWFCTEDEAQTAGWRKAKK